MDWEGRRVGSFQARTIFFLGVDLRATVAAFNRVAVGFAAVLERAVFVCVTLATRGLRVTTDFVAGGALEAGCVSA